MHFVAFLNASFPDVNPLVLVHTTSLEGREDGSVTGHQAVMQWFHGGGEGRDVCVCVRA